MKKKADFKTINRFRSEKLGDEIDNIFSNIPMLLMEKEYVKYENYFLDGTKIEAVFGLIKGNGGFRRFLLRGIYRMGTNLH